MRDRFDAIVIGSGFGGAVVACRLAERGRRVLVLERGRRWRPDDYPRAPGSAWLWDNDAPQRRNGWIDLRLFPGMAVAQGAGVGGGSLIYANISVEAERFAFDEGWPQEITYGALKPHYDEVGRMLRVAELPDGQETPRTRLLREAAERTGVPDRFRKLPLAVSFDPDWRADDDHAFDPARSRWHVNPQGRRQGTCIHCGNCDIGCPVLAKNTLDLNYLARAEDDGAEVRPLHVARAIVPEDGGYRVEFDRIAEGRLVPGKAAAPRAVVAAGSLGSTELLLRCRDERKSLPALSERLGEGWSANGDLLTPAVYPQRKLSPTRGPTISAAIDYLDGALDGRRMFVEDGGFPDVLGNALASLAGTRFWRRLLGAYSDEVTARLGARDPADCVMPWFGQAVDAGDGRLRLGRPWWAPWRRQLRLEWNLAGSRAVMERFTRLHSDLAEATGGHAVPSPAWTHFGYLVTPHPLGGCRMGESAADGVVDHRGEVFGYPGLYVADGAIVPRPLGLNPSRTIAALAERIAEHMP